jgi:hypothetical protein
MRTLTLSFIFWLVLTSPIMARITQASGVVIDSPLPGDVLQGVVAVTGSSDIDGFVSAEISFSYADDPTETWFLISNSTQPVSNDRLVTWDTTVITDGNYVMRLQVNLTNGTSSEFLVPELRVRNYTPVETPTPLPLAPEATPLPIITSTMTPFPTPTALARNPATLVPMDVSSSILYGGLAAILMFIIIGLYLWLRRK